MEGRAIQGTIDHLASGAADGREASGFLSPEAARVYEIAPEPLVLRYDGGKPVYATIPATQQLYQH
jgi:hypothetical protein